MVNLKDINFASVGKMVFLEESKTERSVVFVGTMCDYDCLFCYYKKSINQIIRHDVYLQMEYFHDYGIKDIEISGGEPTIFNEWFDFLSFAQKKFRNISVISNGRKFADPIFLSDSKNAGLNEILFSLHGYDKPSHEKITNRNGSWDKILKAIENCKSEKMILRLNCTICSENVEHLEEYANLVLELNPVSLNFIPLNCWGDTGSSYFVNYEKVSYHLKKALNIIDDRIRYINVRFIPFCFMVGYEKYVCDFYQHMYDFWDWNVELSKIVSIPITDSFFSKLKEQKVNRYESAIKNRLSKYSKTIRCVKCKFFKICDGIQKHVFNEQDVNPVIGDIIDDPIYFRHGYYTKNDYLETLRAYHDI